MFSLFINMEKCNKILLSIQNTPKKSSKCSWVLNNEAPSLEPSHKKGAGVRKKLDGTHCTNVFLPLYYVSV